MIADAMLAIYADPSSWTQKAMARDAHGDKIHPLDDEATCFCFYGCAARASDTLCRDAYAGPWQDACSAFMMACTKRVPHTMFAWNDDPARTFDDVKAFLAGMT